MGELGMSGGDACLGDFQLTSSGEFFTRTMESWAMLYLPIVYAASRAGVRRSLVPVVAATRGPSGGH